jgi:hypothetical protein
MGNSSKLVVLIFLIIILNIRIVIAQKNNKLSFVIGANINNPTQIFEGSNSPTDIKSLKAWGNIYGALVYKNKYQLSIGNELNEFTSTSNFNNDLYLNIRYSFLKDSLKFHPYFETGLILNTYGESPYVVKSQQSYHFNLGFTYKISNYVKFDFGISQQFRKMELYDAALWNDDEISLTIDRFMIRTGLIFRVL